MIYIYIYTCLFLPFALASNTFTGDSILKIQNCENLNYLLNVLKKDIQVLVLTNTAPP